MNYTCARGKVDIASAWTTPEIFSTIESFLKDWEHRLPADHDARIVLKPNLNNDLVALTGNCVDLRVLEGLLAGLRRRGYRNLCVADGSNVGVERRNIDTFRRLRVRNLALRHQAQTVDLNRDEGRPIALSAGATPKIANTILDCDFLISIPKIKTHAEAGLSCAMKNWVGIAVGQDKRQLHYALGRNIFLLNQQVKPDLILVDGLVGMEGNGPGDGEPLKLGRLLMSDDALLNDRVVCRLVGMPVEKVPYLMEARKEGQLTKELETDIDGKISEIKPIRLAPARSRLAILSESRSLLWLKKAVRPIVSKPKVSEMAYKLKIIQDVYVMEEDSLRVEARIAERCGDCRRCEQFCPTGLSREEVGVRKEGPDCVQCLYCWWVCPKEAVVLSGEPLAMERQIHRYKGVIQEM